MNSKLYVWLVLSIGIGLFAAKMGVLILLDPLQVFHQSWADEKRFIPRMRVQAAGIINNYEFDSIILGTSMTENFSPNESSKVFGVNFVNLSLSGSRFSERAILLDYAFRKNALRNVIISLDGFGRVGEFNDKYHVSNFDYLYNNSRLDDIRVYVGFEYLMYAACGTGLFYDRISRCADSFRSLEGLTEWGSVKEYRQRFGGLHKWFEAGNNKQIREAFKIITRSANCIKYGCDTARDDILRKTDRNRHSLESFDLYILDFAKANPETEFHVFFPPYSRLRYAIWAQESPELFESYLSIIRHVVAQSGVVPNINIYGFDNLDFPGDISNYKDTGHYHPEYDSRILHWMKNGEHRLTAETVNQYCDEVKTLALGYDVITIGEKIEQYLKSPVQ